VKRPSYTEDARCLKVKTIGCGKMIQHKYYGSAFTVGEHM